MRIISKRSGLPYIGPDATNIHHALLEHPPLAWKPRSLKTEVRVLQRPLATPTPPWMQTLQQFMPTGWTMDALHKLISFQSGAASALPQLAIIVGATVLVAALAVNRFQYE